MPMLDRPGRFKAFPTECGLQQKDSGCVQWCAKFVVAQMLDETSGEWVDVTDQAWTIMGYIVVVKKDGDLHNIENLKAALGWDGQSFDGLEQDYSQVCVQITVGSDEYNGKSRLVVNWVNPENWEGAQLKKLDDTALKGLNSKFGAKLRQMGPKPAAGAAVAAPAAPATPAKPLPPKALAKKY